MTKKSIENYFEIIQEASEKELSEASLVNPAIEEKVLPEETVSIKQEDFNEILVEKEDQAYELKKLHTKQIKNKIKEDSDIHDLRKQYVPNLFHMIVAWLIVVASFVFMTGFSNDAFNNPDCQLNCTRFKLNDNVLFAFLTTTTITVIGVFVVAAKWLYPSSSKEEASEKRDTK